MNIRSNFYPSINRLFSGLHPADLFESGERNGDYFRVDIEENDKEYRIQADLPGVRKEDLSINVEDQVLTISARFSREKREDSAKSLRRERISGKTVRQFLLSPDVKADAIQAQLEDGVLNLVLPKAAGKNKREIAIA